MKLIFEIGSTVDKPFKPTVSTTITQAMVNAWLTSDRKAFCFLKVFTFQDLFLSCADVSCAAFWGQTVAYTYAMKTPWWNLALEELMNESLASF